MTYRFVDDVTVAPLKGTRRARGLSLLPHIFIALHYHEHTHQRTALGAILILPYMCNSKHYLGPKV
jgi:hypothetical protein